MRITIIGAGYVGLSLAIILASNNEVTISDKDDIKIKMINDGVSPLREDDILKTFNGNRNTMVATSSVKESMINADLIIIAVSTDFNNTLNRFDLHNVESIINIAHQVNNSATIVIKSTVPVGFTNEICHKYNDSSNLLYCPEFLREGKSLHDNLYPSRIIIGKKTGDPLNDKKAAEFADILKQNVLSDNVQVLFMGYSEAESVKLFSNAFLALRVAFFNELDTFAESKGFNSKDIIEGVCLDSRIGMFYNNPSFGYGGYCLPKDTKQLLADFDVIPHDIISAIISSNVKRKEYILHRIISLLDSIKLKQNRSDIVIGIYRLTMKSNSANCRYSSVIDIINELLKLNYSVAIYEPCDIGFPLWQNVRFYENVDKFKNHVDIIITNRYDEKIADFEGEVYTRDIFFRD